MADADVNGPVLRACAKRS